MRVFYIFRLGEAMSDSEIEKTEHMKKTKVKKSKRVRRRYNSSSDSILKDSNEPKQETETAEQNTPCPNDKKSEFIKTGGPCYQYSTPLSSLPNHMRKRNVHFMNAPNDTPINLVDLDKSIDTS